MECSVYVLLFLDIPSICSAAQVCRCWQNLIVDNSFLWQQLLLRDFGSLGNKKRVVSAFWLLCS